MEQTATRHFTALQGGKHTAILDVMPRPVVHLLVEDRPSCHYCKTGYVIESAATGEWCAFSRNSFALEGNRGRRGLMAFLSSLQERSIPYSGWVIRQERLDALEQGLALWQVIRQDLVPLALYRPGDDAWNIRRRTLADAGTVNQI